jgi:hypothetical protein
MAKRILEPPNTEISMENELVSSYVRLCLSEGVKPDEAYKELNSRLQAIKELKNKPKQ